MENDQLITTELPYESGNFIKLPEKKFDIDRFVTTKKEEEVNLTKNIRSIKVAKSQKETLVAIHQAYEYCNSDLHVSLVDIGAHLGLTKNAVYKRMISLVNINLFNAEDFRYKDPSIKKASKSRCYVFANQDDPSSITPKEPTKSRGGKSNLAKRHDTYPGLETSGLEKPSCIDDSTPIITPRKFQPFEQVLRPKKPNREKGVTQQAQSYRAEFWYRDVSKELVKGEVEVSSSSLIMDQEDLIIVFAVYSLVHNYHASKLDIHFQNQTLPRNDTPISVAQIAQLIGRREDSGVTRTLIRDSLDAIYDTNFNFAQLTNAISVDPETKYLFSERYRVFQKLTPLLKASEMVDGESPHDALRRANMFLVSLPDEIFESILKKESLFAFPRKILTLQPFFFRLYLRLRNRVKPNKSEFSYNENIQRTLYKSFVPDKSIFYHAFKRQIRQHLNRFFQGQYVKKYSFIESAHNEKDDIYTINLFGYNCRFDMQNDELYVTGFRDEVTRFAVGEESDAPTIFNPTSALYKDEIDREIKKSLSSELKIAHKKYHILFKSIDHTLCSFSTHNQIASICNILSEVIGTKAVLINSVIDMELGKIDAFVIGERELSKDDVEWLLSLASPNLSLDDINVAEFVYNIYRKRSYHKRFIDALEGNGIIDEDDLKLVLQPFVKPFHFDSETDSSNVIEHG